MSQKLFSSSSWDGEHTLSKGSLLVWILCLATLAVGARNFEPGFSPDSPIYSTISRNIAASGNWFALNADIPDYQPYFADHPHLGFWLVAMVFKVLPAADWSARMVGHFWYVAFLLMFFYTVRTYSGERTATWSIILLWSWYIFSNTFSSFMMDPGVLFFGTAGIFLWERSLNESSPSVGFISGIAFAFALLYKGMALAGFFPCWALIAFWSIKQQRRSQFLPALTFQLAGAFIIVATYVWMVNHSSAPEFFRIYFERQFSIRLLSTWDFFRVFHWGYWLTLLQYTHFLIPLVVFAWVRNPHDKVVWMVSALFLSYFFILPSAGLSAPHHFIMIMPWAAWLISEGALKYISWRPKTLSRVTGTFAIVAVCIIQYFPVKVHGAGPQPVQTAISRLAANNKISRLVLEYPPIVATFLSGGEFAWYGKVSVVYPEDQGLVSADPYSVYFLHNEYQSQASQLESRGWCPHQRFHHGVLYLACQPGSTPMVNLTSLDY